MINLNNHAVFCDRVKINYSGPGFYSGKVDNALDAIISLSKIADLNTSKDRLLKICNKSKLDVKPVKVFNTIDINPTWVIFISS